MKPGERLRLTCALTGTTVDSGSNNHWVRQPPNKGLEWLGKILFSKSSYRWVYDYTSALQNRISITYDASKSEHYLHLSSPMAADTAMYYCAKDTVTQDNSGTWTKKGEVGAI